MSENWRNHTFKAMTATLTAAAGRSNRGGLRRCRDGSTVVLWYSYARPSDPVGADPHDVDYPALLAACAKLDLPAQDHIDQRTTYEYRKVVVTFPKEVVSTAVKTDSMKLVERLILEMCPRAGQFNPGVAVGVRRYSYSRSHMRSRGYILFKFRDLKESDRHEVAHAGLGVLLDRLDELTEEAPGLVTYAFKSVRSVAHRLWEVATGMEVLPTPYKTSTGAPMPTMCYVRRYHLEIRVHQLV